MKIVELESSLPAPDQEKMDRRFMSFLRQKGVSATKKSLRAGDVVYGMRSPKKMIIVSDSWTKIAITDDDAKNNGMVDLAGVREFFARYRVLPSNNAAAKTPKIVDRPIYD